MSTNDLAVIADPADPADPAALTLALPAGRDLRLSHWAFGQLCAYASAPAGYLRTLPAAVAAGPLQHGLRQHRAEAAMLYMSERAGPMLRAVTSPRYGRIMDVDVVEAVQRLAGEEWKVPGVLDWRTGRYDPDAPVGPESTTLYASDQDVFVFLVQDHRPIAVGTLANGEPDLLFPGFIIANSETGARTLVIETMYLRAVCQNRLLFGIERHRRLVLRHTRFAPARFAAEAIPALTGFADAATRPVADCVRAARANVLARSLDERLDVLVRLGFARPTAEKILTQGEAEEGRPAETTWDFAQAITAWARRIPHQDARVSVQQTAGRLLQPFAG